MVTNKQGFMRFYKAFNTVTAISGVVYLVSIVIVILFIEMPDSANLPNRYWSGLISQTFFSFAFITVNSLFVIYCGYYCRKNVARHEKHAAMTGLCIVSAALCVIARMVYGYTLQSPAIVLFNYRGDTAGLIPWTTMPAANFAILNFIYYAAGLVLPFLALVFVFLLRKKTAAEPA